MESRKVFGGLFWKGTIEFWDKTCQKNVGLSSILRPRNGSFWFQEWEEQHLILLNHNSLSFYFVFLFLILTGGLLDSVMGNFSWFLIGKLLFEEQLRTLQGRSFISKTGKCRPIAVTKGTTSRLFFDESVHNLTMNINARHHLEVQSD